MPCRIRPATLSFVLRNLILVAAHAIPYRFDRLDSDDGWYLKPFQKGEGPFYLDHARRGVELAAADARSLLIFAGGQSDPAAGPRSEAQGYWLACDHHGWFGRPEVRARATTEEFSLDSLQNLLFSLCRFHECQGAYPDTVTAVGWEFKTARFDLHRQAIRFPAARYRYVGVGCPDDPANYLPFETARRELFVHDPYGAGPDPAAKRESRNPFHRCHGYRSSCPEVAGLLEHRGPELYAGPLPWS